MTRIANVAVTGKDGLKGQTFALPLTGCDIIAGPHGAGKTTRLIAVLGLALGLTTTTTDNSRPYLRELPRATVTATLDDGAVLSRDLSLTSRAKAWAAEQGAVDARLGARVVSANLTDYERDTDKGREAILSGVLRSAGLGSWTAERVTSTLLDAVTVAPWDMDHPLVSLAPIGDDTAGWVESAIATVTATGSGLFAVANRAAKDTTASADGLAERLSAAEAPAGSLASTDAELADARSRKRAIEDAETRREAASKAHAAHAAEGERLLAAVGAADADRDLADEAVAMSRGELELVPVADTAAGLAAAAKVQALAATYASQTAARDAAVAALDAYRGKVANLQGQERDARTKIAQLVELREAAPVCTHCGAEDPSDINPRIKVATAEADAAAEAIAEMEWDLGPLKDAVVAAKAAMRETEAQQVAASEAHAAERVAYVEAKALRQRAETKHTDAVAWLNKATKRHADAEAQVLRWQATEAPPAPMAPMEQAQGEALDAEIARLDNLRTAHLRHGRLVEEHGRAVAARERAAANLEAVKELKKALLSLREEMARESFGAVEAAAQPLLEGQGLTVIFRSASDFGACVGEGWPMQADYVHFSALSGAQRMLVGAALSVAFASLSGAPWRPVVLDDLQAITSDRLGRFMGRVSALCATGAIQFIGALACEADAAPVVPEGVTVHLVGMDSAGRAA